MGGRLESFPLLVINGHDCRLPVESGIITLALSLRKSFQMPQIGGDE